MTEFTWSFSQTYAQQFSTARNDLQSRLNASQLSLFVSEEQLRQLSTELAELAKSLSDATEWLPRYDRRQYEDQIKILEDILEDLRRKWMPRPRFAFRSKPNTDGVTSLSPVIELEDNRSDFTSMDSKTPGNTSEIMFPRSYQFLDTSSFLSDNHHNLTIADLDHCIVNFFPNSTNSEKDSSKEHISQLGIFALHIRSITDTVLVLPPVHGSVLVHNLARCTLVVKCHQFRMHASHDVDVYLFITSKPVIEDCSGIRFSGYPTTLLPSPGDIKLSQHASVMDFSHIRSTSSPNWSPFAENDNTRSREWSLLNSRNLRISRECLDSIRERFLPGIV